MRFVAALCILLMIACVPSAYAKTISEPLSISIDRTVVIDGMIDDSIVNEAINIIVRMIQESTDDPIYLVLHSRGGSWYAGHRLISTMRGIQKPKIIGIIDGYSYSMAALIALYADELYIVEGSDVMFHEAYYCVCGLSQHMEGRFNHELKLNQRIDKMVSDKLKMPIKEYQERMEKEWWLTDEEMRKRKLAKIIPGITRRISKIPEEESLFSLFFNYQDRDKKFLILQSGDFYFGKLSPDTRIQCTN